MFIGILPNNEIFSRDTLFMNDDDDENKSSPDEPNDDDDDVIILHIDIREPIKRLRTLLEQKIGLNLSKFEFWLQDAQMVNVYYYLSFTKMF